MTTSHIQNTVKMLERYHENIISDNYSLLSVLSGEMAIMQLEREINIMENDEYCNCNICYWVSEFNQELDRRGNGTKLIQVEKEDL